MKKIVSILLIVAMSISLCACGNSNKKAYKLSKEAYGNISAAYSIVDALGTDIYEAWQKGIYEESEPNFLEYLSNFTKLSYDELKLGYSAHSYGEKWEEWTEEKKDEILSNSAGVEASFNLDAALTDATFVVAVLSVISAYEETGKTKEAEAFLTSAKSQMKEMSEKFSDYEHYPALKEYYMATSSFLDYCKSPTGAFEEAKNTIGNYRNSARDYQIGLECFLED